MTIRYPSACLYCRRHYTAYIVSCVISRVLPRRSTGCIQYLLDVWSPMLPEISSLRLCTQSSGAARNVFKYCAVLGLPAAVKRLGVLMVAPTSSNETRRKYYWLRVKIAACLRIVTFIHFWPWTYFKHGFEALGWLLQSSPEVQTSACEGEKLSREVAQDGTRIPTPLLFFDSGNTLPSRPVSPVSSSKGKF